MKFSTWLEYKYINFASVTCGHCQNNLFPEPDIVHNPKHIYSQGQMFSCRCGSSKLWTNSIRNVKNLAAHLAGSCDYYNGFCNDIFCGHCFATVQPLENGVKVPNSMQRMDRYGCTKCDQNQKILVDGSMKDKEGDTKSIMSYYRRHADQVKKLADEGH